MPEPRSWRWTWEEATVDPLSESLRRQIRENRLRREQRERHFWFPLLVGLALGCAIGLAGARCVDRPAPSMVAR